MIKVQKVFTVDEPLYESSCAFYIGVPFDRVMRRLEIVADPTWLNENREELESLQADNGCCIQLVTKEGCPAFGVWVRQWSHDDNGLITLTHEILHLVIGILELKGTPLRRSNDEIICRMQGFYLRKCIRVLIAQNAKAAA